MMAKVFSCLRTLSDETYQQGLARLEADLVQGPVSFTSKYMLLWANKDSGKDLAKTHQSRESSLVTKLELPRRVDQQIRRMETGNHLHRKKRFGNMNSNSSLQQQPELNFIEGGAELLDNVRPLWKKLNALHAEKSPHFADAFAKTKFLERKEELKNKAATGQLLVILAVTKADECIGYCVCSLDKESSVSGAAKIGEIDSMFILASYRRQGIGRKLVNRCMEWFEENEAEKLVVSVGVGNEEVLEFYKSFGLLPRAIRLERKKISKS